jgi:hypothetical protein
VTRRSPSGWRSPRRSSPKEEERKGVSLLENTSEHSFLEVKWLENKERNGCVACDAFTRQVTAEFLEGTLRAPPTILSFYFIFFLSFK